LRVETRVGAMLVWTRRSKGAASVVGYSPVPGIRVQGSGMK
jgi:hypothetical protein